MSISQVEELVQQVVKNFTPETFIYELLAAYGKPRSSITRLQKGNLNLSKVPGEIVWKKNLLFRSITAPDLYSNSNPENTPVKHSLIADSHSSEITGLYTLDLLKTKPTSDTDLHVVIDRLRKSEEITKYNLRFIIVTDYKTFLSVDTKTKDTLDIQLNDLPKFFDFFLPWAGHEKQKIHNESQADIKAAYRMAKLYDEICKENEGMDAPARHSLNVFLSRLLFCFFAEDTEIFPQIGMFTSSIASHTLEDGSDLNVYLDKLFEVLNMEKRSSIPAYLDAFPYVNGGLFADKHAAPKFSRQARSIIIESGELDWSEINPDIFGSMIQAVVHPDLRSETGMHYTSVSNIMKVIEPLFLTELRQELNKYQDNSRELKKLLDRLYGIKIFDPACGSGNFLIIAYKELRKLEMDIYERLRESDEGQKVIPLPRIRLTQFFGIEIDDFAHEVAILSLWLAEHQMNVKFKENFGQKVPALPLNPGGNIRCDNAARLDWEKVCQRDKNAEIYILGNPPYLGSTYQNDIQKQDMDIVFSGVRNYKNLDYISCWFLKAAKFIEKMDEAKFAFVSTNSICQGEQVELLWTLIYKLGLEIFFAHRSFKWQNNAKYNAGVTVAIVGLRNEAIGDKLLFAGDTVQSVQNISPYLTSGKNLIVKKLSMPISNFPRMVKGNQAIDGGNLILSNEEKKEMLIAHPEVSVFMKRFVGSKEFINGIERWCLWIPNSLLEFAKSVPEINKRIELVRKIRLESTDEGARKLASRPHQFREFTAIEKSALIIPSVSSERREYIPIGFLTNDSVISNLAYAIYDAKPWNFTVMASKMHNLWVRAVGGRMRTDIRYSLGLCYNTFPFPELSDKQEETLTTHVFNVLSERERHSEKTMAQLYDPETMPVGLLKAHQDLDMAVDKCYRSRPFSNDDERLEFLFGLYREITSGGEK